MKRNVIAKLHAEFEQIVQTETDTGIEFWFARDLCEALGYSRWENFQRVIEKAVTACQNSGYDRDDHFLDVTKKVPLGSGAERDVDDMALTRYACYLIAQNGDPAKDQIAFAQTYFAVQTRKQEIIEKRLAEVQRLTARKKLTTSEKQLSGIIYERLKDERSFGRIRSKGDRALFGGHTTQDMKNRLNVPKSRPLADFLPTITIKAKDFANEVTTFNVKRDNLDTEAQITDAHVRSSKDVRKVLTKRGIHPEDLPPAEDIKKVQRRVASEERRLPEQVDALPPSEGATENTED